jgi:catechol 2,3-dioxygenase
MSTEKQQSNISIHPATTIGAVHMTVADLDRSLRFYQEALGFQVRQRAGETARLGAGGPDDLLVLSERPGARPARRTTGLYHFAVLVPSRLELARSLRRLAETRTPLQGFSDHLVSEAIYLADPDGNGIEIYRDRPRDEWPRQNGQLQMATDPLDVDGVLAELEYETEPWAGLRPETTIGHIHLHVADLRAADAFYHGVLGFDRILRLAGSADFVSAGGYHHHIGYNTWAGVGAPPPPPDAAGLRFFVVRLPNDAELARVADRVRKAGLPLEETEAGLLTRDPSQNGVVLAT